MGQLASSGQLRMMFLRRALITVPSIVLLGMVSGILSNSGYDNRWFAALAKPSFMPPGWAFPVAWTILYVMMGLALAMIWQARATPARAIAMAMFFVQLALNLAWSPLFFAAHRVHAALFGRIRPRAGLLMVPYLLWLLLATALNYRIDVMNPGAETLAPRGASTQITL
jgi:benzodiazapine receptor